MKIKLALVQMRCGQSPFENMIRAAGFVEKATLEGANIIVLPELFQFPYFCQREDNHSWHNEAESVPGPTTEELSRLARRLGIVLVGGTIIEKGSDGQFFNTATVFDGDGRLLGKYRKTRIPMDEGFFEKSYFSPGEQELGVFRTAFGTVGVGVCYDQWFPELARAAALKGAEILIYPSAIGDIDQLRFRNEESWQKMWLNAHLGHAAANNLFVAAVNRVGQEEMVTFWGGSFVVDPSTKLLAQAGCAEDLVVSECDLDLVREIQDAWGFLKNHRSAMLQT